MSKSKATEIEIDVARIKVEEWSCAKVKLILEAISTHDIWPVNPVSVRHWRHRGAWFMHIMEAGLTNSVGKGRVWECRWTFDLGCRHFLQAISHQMNKVPFSHSCRSELLDDFGSHVEYHGVFNVLSAVLGGYFEQKNASERNH